MPASDVNTTYQPRPLDIAPSPAAVTRTGGDIRAPFEQIGPYRAKLVGSSPNADPFVLLYPHSPWLSATLGAIAAYRNVSNGWDGSNAVAPSWQSLETAEMLAVFLNFDGPRGRPTFSVDALGRPTFAARNKNFYLHLTVDGPQRLTWLAEAIGVEYFSDDVEFKGRRLPDELARILL